LISWLVIDALKTFAEQKGSMLIVEEFELLTLARSYDSLPWKKTKKMSRKAEF
jgi:hypothetical protein